MNSRVRKKWAVLRRKLSKASVDPRAVKHEMDRQPRPWIAPNRNRKKAPKLGKRALRHAAS